MMEEKQIIFNSFMKEFIKLTIDQKNAEIIDKEKTILTLLIKYALENGINYEFIKSREINDIINTNGSNEDYLEAMMVYIHNIEELIGLILSNKITNEYHFD